MTKSQLHRCLQLAGWLGLCLATTPLAPAQNSTFAGNAQHTGLYTAPAQHLNVIRWSALVSLTNEPGYGHYGAPLITAANTVVVPVRIAAGFQVSAFDGATGRLKYTLATDYVLPAYGWLPAYQPVLSTPPSGPRLYYPGAGGTLYYIENPDSDTPGAPVQQCFYTDLATYSSNAAAYNKTVFINTGLTADTNGVIYFGFRIGTNQAPAPLSTTNNGFARLAADGTGLYVLANDAAGDPKAVRVPHNCAPALSNDGQTIYVVARGYLDNYFDGSYFSYLLGLHSATLAIQYKVLLNSSVLVTDDSTASPVVGPDGDVYFGVYIGSDGWLLHFSADLTAQKEHGAFGWDNTPAIVPASMVPSYAGPSSYLLFSKYNNYGSDINRVAILDPNATQVDPETHQSEMREVLTATGCTPYSGSPSVYSVHEWCINAAAVNPVTDSVFMPNEDGRLYRWDLANNALSETLMLGMAVSEGYVPSMIGPDGTVYTLGNDTLFACGGVSNLDVTLSSSMPDLRHTVVGHPVTFTASVSNPDAAGPLPTGAITLKDFTYRSYVATNQTLATNLPLINGLASFTTTALAAGSNASGIYLGNHFISAFYSGDANFPTGSVTLVQKVHAAATATSLNSSIPPPGVSKVIFTARVNPQPPPTNAPTGLVAFWDGPDLLAQVPLSGGTVSFTNSVFSPGTHAFSANYASDTVYADSTVSLVGTPPHLALSLDPGTGAALLVFTNISGAPFSVRSAPEPSWPLTSWSSLGPATEATPGKFQFLDPVLPLQPARFYRVTSP